MEQLLLKEALGTRATRDRREVLDDALRVLGLTGTRLTPNTKLEEEHVSISKKKKKRDRQ